MGLNSYIFSARSGPCPLPHIHFLYGTHQLQFLQLLPKLQLHLVPHIQVPLLHHLEFLLSLLLKGVPLRTMLLFYTL